MMQRSALSVLLVLAVVGAIAASGHVATSTLGPAVSARAAGGPSSTPAASRPHAVLVAEVPCPSALGRPDPAIGRAPTAGDGSAARGASVATGSTAARGTAARSPAGDAQVLRVCGAADALGAVTRAATAGAPTVYGSGPHVRAALAQVAADRPGQRFVAVG